MNFLYGFFYATDDEKNMTVSCAFLLLRAFDAVLLLSKAEFARANPVLCFQHHGIPYSDTNTFSCG